MPEPTTCPKCKADLIGESLLSAALGYKMGYKMGARMNRAISIYDHNLDRTVAWRCPDCKHQWER